MHCRSMAMQYRQKTRPEPQCIGHFEDVYFLQLLVQGAPKMAENRGKIAKNLQKKCFYIHNREQSHVEGTHAFSGHHWHCIKI